jgi:hypothetical protein
MRANYLTRCDAAVVSPFYKIIPIYFGRWVEWVENPAIQ